MLYDELELDPLITVIGYDSGKAITIQYIMFLLAVIREASSYNWRLQYWDWWFCWSLQHNGCLQCIYWIFCWKSKTTDRNISIGYLAGPVQVMLV